MGVKKRQLRASRWIELIVNLSYSLPLDGLLFIFRKSFVVHPQNIITNGS